MNRKDVFAIHNAKTSEVGQEVLSECNELRNLTLKTIQLKSPASGGTFSLHSVDVMRVPDTIYISTFQNERRWKLNNSS